jgi:hypothetical protein
MLRNLAIQRQMEIVPSVFYVIVELAGRERRCYGKVLEL